MKKIPASFYQREDVLLIAREMIGKVVATMRDGVRTSGRIVEVEAYAGVHDKAAHSFGGRRTNRNESMYAEGGVAYVYLCYGIHNLFNMVTNGKDVPQGVLLRAIEPLEGIDEMLKRTGKQKPDTTLTRGPGNVTRALGIQLIHNRTPLDGDEIALYDDGFEYREEAVAASPRIGVAYAGEDAALLYRFYVRGNPYVSAKPR